MTKRKFCFNYITYIADTPNFRAGKAIALAECAAELKCKFEGEDSVGNETYLSGIRELTPREEENIHKMPVEDWRYRV